MTPEIPVHHEPAAGLEDTAVLIPAAGAGERLRLGPKAFLRLGGETLLERVVGVALRFSPRVVAAVPPDRLEEARRLCPGCRCIAGGASRQQSVLRLVQSSEEPWVLIHDVSRPFVSETMFRSVVAAAREVGAAGTFLRPKVPAARIDGGGMVQQAFETGEIGIFETPLAFSRPVLQDALERAEREGWKTQATIQLVIRAGFRVKAVDGEPVNIKITTPQDWDMALRIAGWSA